MRPTWCTRSGLLAKWTQQLGLGGRMFYAVGGGRQARQVVLVLHGLKDGLKAFVQRLRTENVDVNRAGKACKERQSTVVQQGAALTEPRSVLLGCGRRASTRTTMRCEGS